MIRTLEFIGLNKFLAEKMSALDWFLIFKLMRALVINNAVA